LPTDFQVAENGLVPAHVITDFEAKMSPEELEEYDIYIVTSMMEIRDSFNQEDYNSFCEMMRLPRYVTAYMTHLQRVMARQEEDEKKTEEK